MNMMKIGMVALAVSAFSAVYAQDAVETEELDSVEAEESEEPASAVEEDGIYGWTPIAVGLASPCQYPWGLAKWDVYGFDFNLFYADAPRMYGLELSCVNRTREDLRGVMLSAFCNWSTADVYGFRGTLGGNFCAGTTYGVDMGGVALRKGDFYGVDCEFVGGCQRNMYGIQIAGGMNVTEDVAWGISAAIGINVARTVRGMQAAVIFNQTDELTGCQIGVVNYAHECPCGFQIGVINIISDNLVKATPLFNCYFGRSAK